ncbi:hypothetical protein chiPu_0022732 [Chiloscyllium punctatum]|uniref:Uncharacterized protein n=1 Tax=Chiloscyllium punctatum TaxID=137246 RepID=A0A401T951_CHIPU|nr:hypothetical protein [Chiloscyllium punctatum]
MTDINRVCVNMSALNAELARWFRAATDSVLNYSSGDYRFEFALAQMPCKLSFSKENDFSEAEIRHEFLICRNENAFIKCPREHVIQCSSVITGRKPNSHTRYSWAPFHFIKPPIE